MIKRLLDVPENFKVVAVIPIEYPMRHQCLRKERAWTLLLAGKNTA